MFTVPKLYFERLRKVDKRITPNNYIQIIRDVIGREEMTLDQSVLWELRCLSEVNYRTIRRPYYKVYPKILSALCKVSLDLPISSINYPVDTLMILLPSGQKDIVMPVRSELVPLTALIVDMNRTEKRTIFSVFGYVNDDNLDFFSFGAATRFIDTSDTIEYALTKIYDPNASKQDAITTYIHKWIKLAVALSLLGKDSDLIVPDILNGDTVISDHTIGRAHRRGKIGWKIGCAIEVCPHVRIPHLFNCPCGPGSQQRKLMWRKGSVVHRDKIKSIPTGFEG